MNETRKGASDELIAETLSLLERPELPRESIGLLVVRLLELRNPGKTVEMPEDAEINLLEFDGSRTKIYIHNLLSECARNSSSRVEIVERYLRGLCPESRDIGQSASRDDVVALIRDLTYRDFVVADDRFAPIRHLVGDLYVLYAIDSPQSTTVLTNKKIAELGINSTEIDSLGKKNIERLLGDLEIQSSGEFHVLVSKSSEYLSAALLLDYVWKQAQILIEGDIVVAVPARDTVIFTGSSNYEGLRVLREQSEYVVRNGNHVISTTLLRRAGGAWKLFS